MPPVPPCVFTLPKVIVVFKTFRVLNADIGASAQFASGQPPQRGSP